MTLVKLSYLSVILSIGGQVLSLNLPHPVRVRGPFKANHNFQKVLFLSKSDFPFSEGFLQIQQKTEFLTSRVQFNADKQACKWTDES